MFLDTLKKDNSIISLEMPLYATVIHLRVALPMDVMAVSMAIRSWIPSPIHTASSSSFSKGKLRVAELRSICHEFELNIFWEYCFHILSHMSFKRCHKQVDFLISPGHHVAHAYNSKFLFPLLPVSWPI